MPHPVIRLECSEQLLQDLHAAHKALQRSKAKLETPALNRLIVAVAGARMKVEPLTLGMGHASTGE